MPAKLSAQVRMLWTDQGPKNDRLDASFTALAALNNERLVQVDPEDDHRAARRSQAATRATRRPARGAHLHPEPYLSTVCSRTWYLVGPPAAFGRRGGPHPCSVSAATHVWPSSRFAVVWPPSCCAPFVRALDRKIVALDELVREEVEASVVL